MVERDDGIIVTSFADILLTSESEHAVYRVIYRGEENFSTTLHQLLHPGKRSSGHRHKEPEVYFVVQGTLILITERDDILAPAGTVIFVPGGIAHAVENPSGEEPNINIILMGAGFKRGTEVPVEL